MQRIRELGLLQALVEGREEGVGRTLRSRAASTPTEEERAWERVEPADPPQPPPPIRPPPARGMRSLLRSRRSLRQAMIVHEVLGPPKSLRPD